ncbi:MAG TPA: lysylphosphatidylglycerol synthase transmembrane domain-containing protein [Rhodocyclaceae bacterium]|nr:lysylphosphatidylglycerol synthase transmembrane domain-containing protein [Rhodocyclaceae bacterium]
MGMRRAAFALSAVGVGLAVGAPFMLFGNVLASLQNVASHVIAILAAIAVTSAIAKTGKLQILLRSLGQRPGFVRTFAITLVTDFAFLCSPAGAAGYVANIALLQRTGASWSVATTVVGADQALDLVFFAIAVPIATFFALGPLTQALPKTSHFNYAIVLLIGAACIGVLWFNRQRILTVLRAFIRAIPWLRTRQGRLKQFGKDMRVQIAALLNGHPKWNFALLLCTALQWLLRYGALWYALVELHRRLPFGFVLVMQAMVLHLAQWTGVPAGGGSADLGLAAMFSPWITQSTIATALILWRFATLYVPLILGGLGFVVLARIGMLSNTAEKSEAA